jgi:hypothetical protein
MRGPDSQILTAIFLSAASHPATVLWNEFDSGGLERKPQGFDSSRRHGSPVSLEFDHGCQRKPRRFRKPCLCPIKQPAGRSALRFELHARLVAIGETRGFITKAR